MGFLEQLLDRRGLSPADVDEIYVSVGPGSFTGTRVGVTVARTFAQAVEGVRCVAVPTPRAVVEALEGRPGQRADVLLDARRGNFYISPFVYENGAWCELRESFVSTMDEYAAGLTGPVTLAGEGLGYCRVDSPHATPADESLWLPRVENVWKVGRTLAAEGACVDYHQLLPKYTGKPFVTKKPS